MTEIYIRTNPKFKPLRVLYAFSVQFALISIGIAAESPAMQWMGFVMVVLIVLVLAVATVDSNKAVSFDEARRMIDDMEAKESDQ